MDVDLLKHLRLWVASKRQLFSILNATVIDKYLLNTMQANDFPYSDEIIEASKLPETQFQNMGCKYLKEYVEGSLTLWNISSIQAYLIAKTLYKGILDNNYEMTRGRQFINPIHQFLARMIRESDEKQKFVDVLSSWLTSHGTVYNTSRNFAAFELGMIRAEQAVDILLSAITNPRERLEVRYYSVIALGMIKNKLVADALIQQYYIEEDQDVKKAIVNVLHYLYKY